MKKERRVIIGAHWKMNKGYKEGIEWIKKASTLVPSSDKVETIVFPQYPLVHDAVLNAGSNLKIGVQNVHFEESGSYTGEVSVPLIAEIGGKYSLVGHSERWKMYNESHEDCNKKVLALLKHQMVPILNIGEEAPKNDEEGAKKAIRNEIDKELNGVTKEDAPNVVLSFEPIWAVGTGSSDTCEYAEKFCKLIRGIVAEKFGEDVAKKMRILYSASTSPENLKSFLSQPDIDGALVGKKGLDLDTFIKMAKIAEEFA